MRHLHLRRLIFSAISNHSDAEVWPLHLCTLPDAETVKTSAMGSSKVVLPGLTKIDPQCIQARVEQALFASRHL